MGFFSDLFGGGDSQPAPDYTPLANASKESAEIAAKLGREQLAENTRQYDKNMAVAAPIIEKQAGLMDQQITQGDDYFNYNKNTFRPIEQGLADEAQTGVSRYATNDGVKAAVEEEATRAGADQSRATENMRDQNMRAMEAMGVNPNSGKFAAMKTSEGLASAASRAGAVTGSRQKGVALDYAKRMDVTGLGRNLTGASQGAYGLANAAGNSAVANQNATSGQYINGMTAGNGTIMQGQGLQLQGLSNIASGQTSTYNAGLAAAASRSNGMMSMVGGAVGLVASDIRLKENIVRVEGGEIPMYEFNYIGQPDTRFRGVMAQDVLNVRPEAVGVAPDGFMYVNYGLLGIEMVEV
jgi:hypothetical protein